MFCGGFFHFSCAPLPRGRDEAILGRVVAQDSLSVHEAAAPSLSTALVLHRDHPKPVTLLLPPADLHEFQLETPFPSPGAKGKLTDIFHV